MSFSGLIELQGGGFFSPLRRKREKRDSLSLGKSAQREKEERPGGEKKEDTRRRKSGKNLFTNGEKNIVKAASKGTGLVPFLKTVLLDKFSSSRKLSSRHHSSLRSPLPSSSTVSASSPVSSPGALSPRNHFRKVSWTKQHLLVVFDVTFVVPTQHVKVFVCSLLVVTSTLVPVFRQNCFFFQIQDGIFGIL